MTAPRAARVETPADTLRRAAAKVREMAAEATPGPWASPYGIGVQTVPRQRRLDGIADRTREADAYWIAAFNPAVAEPLAAWLDWASCTPEQATHHAAALTLAHALLGSPVPEPDGEGTA